MNPIELPDLKTICKKQIPTIRYTPLKFRLSRSEDFTKTIEGCVSKPNSTENWKKLFAISKCILRASHRGGNKQSQENLLSIGLSARKRGTTPDFSMMLHRCSNQENPLMEQKHLQLVLRRRASKANSIEEQKFSSQWSSTR